MAKNIERKKAKRITTAKRTFPEPVAKSLGEVIGDRGLGDPVLSPACCCGKWNLSSSSECSELERFVCLEAEVLPEEAVLVPLGKSFFKRPRIPFFCDR